MIVTEVQCRTILNRTGGFLGSFTHTINPYRGCAFGMTLCGLPDYAPVIAAAFGEKRPWGGYLDAKVNAGPIYEKDHDRVRSGANPSLRIYMSSVTDPYVPQERALRITAAILERMRDRPPDLLALQTHTPNPLWDIDLLADLSRRFPMCVQVSVETDREQMGPGFPPHAYPVAARLAAMRSLRQRGIQTVGVVAPLWPIDDLDRFAASLDEACDFVVVDHYLLGDGSCGGARTRRRLIAPGMTFPDMLAAAGHEEWTRLEALDRVAERLGQLLGPARVGVSKEGFNRAAHRLLPAPSAADGGRLAAGRPRQSVGGGRE